MRAFFLALTLSVSFGVCRAQETTLPTRVNGGGTVPIASQLSKRALKHSDYAGWKSVAGAQLSPDGTWVSFAINPQEGDGTLFFKKQGDASEWKIERGGGVRFSSDSKWAVLTVAPKFADTEAAKKAKKDAPKPVSSLIELASGKVETLEKIRRVVLPEESSDFLALHAELPKDAPKAPAPQGTELTLRPLLSDEKPTVLPDVTSFQLDKAGKFLVYVVDGKDDSKDGVYLRNLTSGETVALALGPGEISGLAFDESGTQAAFVKKAPAPKSPPSPRGTSNRPEGDESEALQGGGKTPRENTSAQLFLWHAGEKAATEISEASENAPPRFLKDGSGLVFGVAPTPKPKTKDVPEPLSVDIWTTRDGLIQPMQKIQLAAEQKRTYARLYRIAEKKIVTLADEKRRDVSVGAEAKKWALGSDPLPYQAESAYDDTYRDYFLVDLKTGAQRKVLTHHGSAVSLSPSEKWLLWWDGEKHSWWVQDSEGKAPPRDLTGALKTVFYEEDWDTPASPNPYGVAAWTTDDKRVLLYDRFDLWAVDPASGQAERLTQGRERGVSFRYVRLDPEERQIPEDKPLYLASTDDSARATGFWRLGSLKNPALTKLLVYDGQLGGLQKAKNSDAVVLTRERFEVFPDLWCAPSLEKLSESVRLTDANPQQKSINWGRSERIVYRTNDGKELPAILTVPEDFDPAKKYPLLVYVYEKLASGLHRYTRPGPGTSINLSRYASNGYVILQPDIEYREGYPGESALSCVVPAVQEVLRRGFIDEKRIGLQGHSWGAYQASYLITRTNLFRAVEAGASVSNMFSAYGGVRYETGMSRQFQYEKTQSRIGATPWQKPLAYLENSPIFWADKVQTPYLSIHNDNDGAVPWTQGIEFFMALKRLNKEAYLFNYNGEGHGLTNRENQKHWTVHMAEFFDHYLLGKPRPAWMDQGVPYAERGARDLRPLFRE